MDILFLPKTVRIKTSACFFFNVLINTTLLVSTAGVHTLSQLGIDGVFNKYVFEISLCCFFSYSGVDFSVYLAQLPKVYLHFIVL